MNLKKRLLKNPTIISLIVNIVKSYVWLVLKTSKVQFEIDEEAESLLNNNDSAILLSWHNRILILPKILQKFGKLYAIVSRHEDGSYLSDFITSYGHGVIRGSSKRDAVHALIGLRKQLEIGGAVMITPDGPRGPREKINSNIAGIIKKFAVPVIFISYAANRKFICKSWDRFIIPLPFSKMLIVIKNMNNNNMILYDNTNIESYMVATTNELDECCG